VEGAPYVIVIRSFCLGGGLDKKEGRIIKLTGVPGRSHAIGQVSEAGPRQANPDHVAMKQKGEDLILQRVLAVHYCLVGTLKVGPCNIPREAYYFRFYREQLHSQLNCGCSLGGSFRG